MKICGNLWRIRTNKSAAKVPMHGEVEVCDLEKKITSVVHTFLETRGQCDQEAHQNTKRVLTQTSLVCMGLPRS
jgi:ectoine hydroxylase-related dioxygenase (phytanoyl-CoA dioxygenase family)